MKSVDIRCLIVEMNCITSRGRYILGNHGTVLEQGLNE
jgi:hypothetical protein